MSSPNKFAPLLMSSHTVKQFFFLRMPIGSEADSKPEMKCIHAITKDAERMIGSLHPSRKHLTLTSLVYHSKCQRRPRMKYCCYIWADAAQSSLPRHDRVQKWLHSLMSDVLFSILKSLTILSLFLWQLFKRVKPVRPTSSDLSVQCSWKQIILVTFVFLW